VDLACLLALVDRCLSKDEAGYKFSEASPPGGDSHLEISLIPMLGDSSYTREYRLGARAWQGFVANLSSKGGHLKANVKWQRRRV
jgi:hypothetical protein